MDVGHNSPTWLLFVPFSFSTGNCAEEVFENWRFYCIKKVLQSIVKYCIREVFENWRFYCIKFLQRSAHPSPSKFTNCPQGQKLEQISAHNKQLIYSFNAIAVSLKKRRYICKCKEPLMKFFKYLTYP